MLLRSYGNSDTGIIVLVLSFLAALILSIIFLPKGRRDKMGKAGQFFHDLIHFRHFFIGDILKFVYIFLTVFIILAGLFSFPDDFLSGLLVVILGPILVRLIYEFTMMFISLVENVSDINKKVKGTSAPEPQAPAGYNPPASSYNPPESYASPVQEPVNYASFVQPVQPAEPTPVVEQVPHYAPTPEPAPQQSQVVYCTNCGAPCDGDSRFCMNCGATIQ